MKNFLRTLPLAIFCFSAPLSAAESTAIETFHVTIDGVESTLLDEIVFSAENVDSGEITLIDREAYDFSLPAGTYTFSGESNWCFATAQTLEIAADTEISFTIGCE